MTGTVGDRWDGQVGKKTFTRCVSLVQLAPFLENKKLLEIDGRPIGHIVRERGAVITKATVKRDLCALSSVMNYAVAQEYRENNPVLPWLKNIKERRDPIVEPGHVRIITLGLGHDWRWLAQTEISRIDEAAEQLMHINKSRLIESG
jgi:hypothetical protein